MAVDGNTHGNSSIESSRLASPHLKIDLGSFLQIGLVRVHNRGDLDGASLMIWQMKGHVLEYALKGNKKVYEVNVNAIGRSVWVMRKCTDCVLYLAEVQVFSPKPKSVPWKHLPGAARDIGVGADGTVWVIGTDGGAARHPLTGKKMGRDDFGIHRWTGRTWEKIPGGAARIAVGPKGNAWVVNSAGEIFRHDGSSWIHIPGGARDIGVGADGTVWVIGMNKVGDSFGIYRWTGKKWSNVKGGGVRIAVDPKGNACVVNHKGELVCHDGKAWAQLLLPFKASDIGIGANGQAWITGPGGVWRRDGKTWTLHTGALERVPSNQIQDSHQV